MSTVESSLARRRYAEVEAAYTSGLYAQALNDGLSLLQDLEDPANQPLRMRLLLLLAHTWLYGLGDQDSAAVAYRQVAEESEEPPLQEIAAEGLNRSTAAVQPVPGPTIQDNADSREQDGAPTAGSVSQEPASDPFGSATNPEPRVVSSAAPWLSDLSSRGDQDPAGSGERLQTEALAPFQQPPALAAATASEADPPWVQPTKGFLDSRTPDWVANTISSASPGSTAAPDSTTPPGPVAQASVQTNATQAGRREQNRPQDNTTEAETTIVPSTLSFSAEEEQELAKGLLLVVLG